MMRAENSSLPELWVLPRSCSKNTPGERCSWDTITRSVPLMMNEPVVRHERNLAHVHLLLLDLLHGGLGGFAVHDGQAHLGAQRRGEGQAALLALLHVERRDAELVAHELQARIARMAHDREDGRERRLQSLILRAVRAAIRLQKRGVGVDLRRQQEGTCSTLARFAKLLRIRFFSVKE